MKKLLTSAAIILLTTATPVLAQDARDMAERMEMAKEYSEIMPVEDDIAAAIDEMAKQVPVDQRPLFRSILERSIKADRIQTTSELALAEIFTVEELEMLVEFYSTDEGKAVKRKMPEYQARLQPVIQQMVQDAVQSLQAQSN